MKKFFTSTFPNFMAHETLYICFPWYNTHLGFVPNTSLWTFSIYFLLIPPYFVDFCMLNADVNVKKINNKIIGRKCKQIYDIRISKDIMAKDSETIKKKGSIFYYNSTKFSGYHQHREYWFGQNIQLFFSVSWLY